MVLSQHAHVVDVDGVRLTVGFANAGARDSFVNGGCDEILRQASIDVVGMDWKVESIRRSRPGAVKLSASMIPTTSFEHSRSELLSWTGLFLVASWLMEIRTWAA